MLTLGTSMNLEEDQDAIVGVLSGMTTSAYSVGEFIGPLIGGVMVTFLQFQDSCIVSFYVNSYHEVHDKHF